MKILYLSSVRIPSEKASGLAIVRQCQAFADLGHELTLWLPNRDGKKSFSITDAYGIVPHFTVQEVCARGIYSWGMVGFVYMMLRDAVKAFLYFNERKSEYDLIYSRDHRLLLLFVLFGYREKCFLEIHSKHDDVLTKFVVKRVKKVIVISEGLKSFYKEFSSRKDIQVEPSGVDLEQFEDLPDSIKLKGELGLSPSKIVYGYIGKTKTMGEGKGVEEIVQAFALMHKMYDQTQLLLVGVEPDEKSYFCELAIEYCLPRESLVLHELNQARFARYVMAADVLLMNYTNTDHYTKYMSPTKLFAYMAAGKPVVATDLFSIRSLLELTGFVFVEPNSADSLCEGMKKVYIDYNNFRLMASKNGNLAQQFSWHNRAGRIFAGLDF